MTKKQQILTHHVKEPYLGGRASRCLYAIRSVGMCACPIAAGSLRKKPRRHIAVCANTKNKPKAPPKQVAAFTDRLGVRRGGRGKLSCTFNEKAKVKSMLGASLQPDMESNKQTKKLENKPDAPKKKDARERLSRLWGEIIFLLRKPIRNE